MCSVCAELCRSSELIWPPKRRWLELQEPPRAQLVPRQERSRVLCSIGDREHSSWEVYRWSRQRPPLASFLILLDDPLRAHTLGRDERRKRPPSLYGGFPPRSVMGEWQRVAFARPDLDQLLLEKLQRPQRAQTVIRAVGQLHSVPKESATGPCFLTEVIQANHGHDHLSLECHFLRVLSAGAEE